MQKPNFQFYFCFSLHFKGREIVTAGGSIQNFMIPNIANVEDDPIFSVSGDIAMNWWYADNGVRIVLTGGHLSARDENDYNSNGLGIHLALKGEKKIEGKHANYKLEISNIQNCLRSLCQRGKLKVQGKNHGKVVHLKSGPVYGNYAIYVSNSTAKFPTDQNLGLVIEGKKYDFTIVCHIF